LRRQHYGSERCAGRIFYRAALASFPPALRLEKVEGRGIVNKCAVGACQQCRYSAGFGDPRMRAYNAPVAAFYCYILECSDGSLYTGWTSDPERRLRQHNSGHGGRYTRSRRPLKLKYVESQPSRSTAMQRERSIKSLPRQRKLALIREAQDAPMAHQLDGENDVQT
jgi:putative endonuclease